MSLIHEAVVMLSAGIPIRAPAADDLTSTITLERTQGAFVLHAAGNPQRFDQAVHAVISFRRLVGPAGLSNAVGDVRYQAMFPQGSSLGWSPIPVHGSC